MAIKSRTKASSKKIVVKKKRASNSAPMRGAPDKTKGLSELFLHGIQDIYYAERKLTKALPKMIKVARSQDLIDALTGHLAETEEHVTKVEHIFGYLGKPIKAKRCEAIDGIVAEAESIMKDFGNSPAGDAAIIFAGQAAEHYEITRYGSLRAFAEILKYRDIEKLIESILEQEKAADEKLTKIAEDRVDWAAEHDTDDNPNGTPADVQDEKHTWRFWK